MSHNSSPIMNGNTPTMNGTSEMERLRKSPSADSSEGFHNETFLFTSESVGEGHPGEHLLRIATLASIIMIIN